MARLNIGPWVVYIAVDHSQSDSALAHYNPYTTLSLAFLMAEPFRLSAEKRGWLSGKGLATDHEHFDRSFLVRGEPEPQTLALLHAPGVIPGLMELGKRFSLHLWSPPQEADVRDPRWRHVVLPYRQQLQDTGILTAEQSAILNTAPLHELTVRTPGELKAQAQYESALSLLQACMEHLQTTIVDPAAQPDIDHCLQRFYTDRPDALNDMLIEPASGI